LAALERGPLEEKLGAHPGILGKECGNDWKKGRYILLFGKRPKEWGQRKKDGWTCEGVHPAIVFARVRNALKRKGVARFLKELVCAKSAQAEENAGFVFCGVKRGSVVTEKRAISACARSE